MNETLDTENELVDQHPDHTVDAWDMDEATIQELRAALKEVMEPQFINPWLDSPNESFDGLKPLEVIERGEIDRIWQMIYELRSGTAF